MAISIGFIFGFIAWFLVRYLAGGIYTVNQNERAVKTSFGRAERVGLATTLNDPISESLEAGERERVLLSASASDPARRTLLQMALGKNPGQGQSSESRIVRLKVENT